MKNAPTGKTNKSALNALLSIAIIANNPSTQQAYALLALMTFALRGVAL